ncbi:hypothetical protein H8B06_13790 [Sphingobacterium sp. DN00404]|uniref:DUF4468 domain-containing protein n=1 Tax=Sphingobacterium micropteri TaxID=2763501 RepID=A0ABR7YRI4_9SPHI|nr:hypothetical protein [Sphingobacterium micropteri]MBD1433905.1 hypothetical protein [Sphingobacterium micropteri]
MKTPFLILLQTLWLIFALAGTPVPTTMQIIPDTAKKAKQYFFVDLTDEVKTTKDTLRKADEKLLKEAFEKYFAKDESTIHTQVNISPCQTTIIETYSYYGNPHIRLWTFYTDLFTIGPGLNGKIRIDIYRGTVYDSRIKSISKFGEIDLTGIPGNTMEYRDRLERAWYRYKEHCNEPPEAY